MEDTVEQRTVGGTVGSAGEVNGPPADPIRPADRRQVTAVKVGARGEQFRIVQVHGTLFVYFRQGGSCCCGWEEKGRMPFEHPLFADEWDRRKIRNRLQLVFAGGLGPCAASNSALLQIYGHSIWLSDLNDPSLVVAHFDYAEEMLDSGQVRPPPELLRGRICERHLPFDGGYVALAEVSDAADGLDRLDPVCPIDVDPATARYKVEHNGRVIEFCVPSCRRQFLADPEAYSIA